MPVNCGSEPMVCLQPSYDQECLLRRYDYARLNGKAVSPYRYSVLEILGPVDKSAIHKGLAALIARHPSLRSSFEPSSSISRREWQDQLRLFSERQVIATDQRLYIQRIHDTASVDVRTYERPECRGPETQRAALARILAADEQGECDHSRPPQLRVTVIAYPARHLVVLAVPRVTCDATSSAILLRDFQELYAAAKIGDLPQPPASDTQYFATIQRMRAGLPELARRDAARFWRRHWAEGHSELITSADLPIAYPSTRWTSSLTPRSATQWMRCEPKSVPAFASLSGDDWITCLHICAAALTLVLFRFTAKCRVPLWVHVPNRSWSETCQVVDWCSNLHMVPTDTAACASPTELLAQISNQMTDAMAHAAWPLELLWREFDYRPGPGIPIELEMYPPAISKAAARSGLRVRPWRAPGIRLVHAVAQLGIHLCDTDPALSITYSTASFSDDAARTLLGAFRDGIGKVTSAAPGRFRAPRVFPTTGAII